MARLERIYTQIKPDTLGFWEGVFNASSRFLLKHTGTHAMSYARNNSLIEIIVALSRWSSGYCRYR